MLACLLSADINLDHNWVSLLGFFSCKVTMFPFPGNKYLRGEILGLHASSPLRQLNQREGLLAAQMVEGFNVGFNSLILAIFIIWDSSLQKLFTFSQFMGYYFYYSFIYALIDIHSF